MRFHTPDGSFEVVPYDRRWADDFEAVKTVLDEAIPGAGIHHMGSTSVPGLSAKPTIDVLVTYGADADLADLIERLETAGFEHRPAAFAEEADRHLFFRKVRPDGTRSHHLHVLRDGSARARDYLVFRDFLRSHPAAASDYEAAKLRLVRTADSRAEYTEQKTATVEALLAEARSWSDELP